MEVLCIRGHEGILEEGEVYNVSGVTSKGNFILEGVEVPEGYTSFNQNRFAVLETVDLDDWNEEMEEQYWSEQPPVEYNA